MANEMAINKLIYTTFRTQPSHIVTNRSRDVRATTSHRKESSNMADEGEC